MRMLIATVIAASAAPLVPPVFAGTYPLDGYETTGIRRLLAIRLVEEGELPGSKQPSGAS